ncbi:MAG: hypothetical protein CMA63_02685 [Euryarchaeota archaeon]|nr:hypothetical protein [Euryarchaeota archaeon]|tara:strand:+ start:27197 stop:28402 length:1206 start_codon:yes stop_codon:yes gene_type:complete
MGYSPVQTDAGSLAAADMAYRSAFGASEGGPADGTVSKLWLPIWSGEVLHAYDSYKLFEPMVTAKTLESGRTMEFPITGTVTLKAEWNAGEYLHGGEDAKNGNFSVSLDGRPMAAHFELDNIDLMITQWEYRQELARQAGQTLANARDKQIGVMIAAAGCVSKLDSDPRTGITLPAVKQIENFTAPDAAAALEVLGTIEEFITDCQENSVPMSNAYCAVTPKMFQQIRRLGVATSATNAINMQPMFGGVAQAGGLGAPFTEGMHGMDEKLVYMGVTICKTNHIPNQAYDTSKIGAAKYNVHGNDAQVEALLWMPECVASLRKTGLVVDTEDDIRRNTTFTVASMLSGTGILKPELAKVIVRKRTTAAENENRTKVGGLLRLPTDASPTDAENNAFFGYDDI